jgi:hypothetical protein
MANLILNGSTSGSVTLSSPAVSGTTTLTLPTTSGTVITTGSSGQSIPKAALPTGSVLQVLNTQSSTTVTTSGSGLSTILTLSITPTSSSSKILAFGTVNLSTTNVSNGFGTGYIYRGATGLGYLSIGINSAVSINGSITLMFLDAPSTTSSTSYTLQIARGSGGTTSVTTDGTYTLTLMEIAA